MDRDNGFSEMSDRLKQLGYAESKRIRIYGQEFEVLSNPFPQGRGIAVKAVLRRTMETRILQLPLPVLQMVRSRHAGHK
jgi:hypothetical protein